MDDWLCNQSTKGGGKVVIPELDPVTHRLPFTDSGSPYLATLDEIRNRYVDGRLGSPRRRLIWQAFSLWGSLTAETLPGARIWISGSFVTDKTYPSDLDAILVVEARHEKLLEPLADDVRVLLTHRNIKAEQPAGEAERLQPVGGLIDGFICPGHSADHVAYWQTAWSTEYDKVTRLPTGVRMGYLEVGM